MRVSKWGNSLAVRLPAAVVQALELKEGERIEVQVVGARSVQVGRPAAAARVLARLRKYRGRLPADFRFDRLEANGRQ
jgi:antitoxin MazE